MEKEEKTGMEREAKRQKLILKLKKKDNRREASLKRLLKAKQKEQDFLIKKSIEEEKALDGYELQKKIAKKKSQEAP
jgi:hypothetical protein